MKQEQIHFTQRALSALLSVLLATQPMLPAVAATLTPSGTTRLDSAANGVPVINIATPNASGISHNKYTDYNVGKEGLILNNATGKMVQTQLGGVVQSNPNLKAGQEAKGIINEVTGTSRSQLNGYTEVAGKAANVMVANPYGITCNGCGFINTPNATLTTGKPVLDASGKLQSLEISKGAIVVEGLGLDASQSDAVSIIARAAEINAQLHAKDLRVIAGSNRVTPEGSVSALKGEGTAPKVAVDTGALGGMYANRIRLVSSEKGLGVNLGELNARQGDISLDASGKLSLSNTLASGAIVAGGQSVQLSGAHKAGTHLTVNSAQDLMLNNATLLGDKNLHLTAGGTLAQNGGRLTAGQDLALNAGTFTQSQTAQANAAANITLQTREGATTQGALIAGKGLSVTGGPLTHSGQWSAGESASVKASAFDNRGTLKGKQLAVDSTTLNNRGGLNSAGAMNLTARTATLGGDMAATGDLTLNSNSLTTLDGARLQSEENLRIQSATADLRGTHSAGNALEVNAGSLTHSGKSSAPLINIHAPALTNSGVLTAPALAMRGQNINNSGLIQGSESLSLEATRLLNQQNGLIYSTTDLNLRVPELDNRGVITSDTALHLSGNTLTNSGELSADRVALQYGQLSSTGLIQGNRSLSMAGNTLNAGDASRSLTAGTLTLSATDLYSGGHMQGQDINVAVADWRNSGTLLSAGSLVAQVSGALRNHGELLSHGNATLRTATLDNRGAALSAGAMTAEGEQLSNSGTLQAATLALHQDSVTNQGTITGIQALTLASRLAMAAPQMTLVNETKGKLLTSGELNVSAGSVTSKGLWQGQKIVLSASDMTHSGSLQSADALHLAISANLISSAGSKITANGDAAIQALGMTHDGQWIASRLTLSGDALGNNGDITGVNGLHVTLSNGLTQRTGKLLSAGDLSLTSAGVNNAGQIQGKSNTVSTKNLANSGRIQGENSLHITAQETTNAAAGVLLSQNALALSTGSLTNAGIIQGNGESSVTASSRLQNAGKLMSGGKMTLSTPEFINTGWWQAGQLVLNAAKASNSGTWIASGRADLNGSTLSNTGKVNGADLRVNYTTLTNGGTLLGNSALTVTADTLDHQQAGALFSAGDLRVNATGVSLLGQVVALGNVTLDLVLTFTHTATLAAGSTLSVTSQGAVTNQGVMQGNAVVLNAGNALTNSGKIVTGSGSSQFSGSRLTFSEQGSLQGGGDITLTSRSDVTLAGFTGTAGSMTVSAAGALLNTAMLYAAQNMKLFADRIHNQYGDILAGNSLWMQKNAAGAANTEVVNRSGNIETQKGDITVKTGYLLNERDGLEVTETRIDGENAIPGLGNTNLSVDISLLPEGSYGILKKQRQTQSGACNANGACNYNTFIQYYYGGFKDSPDQKFIANQTGTSVASKGGAARIASGNNLVIDAGNLSNQASNILAKNNITLTGNQLSNQSWQSGHSTEYFFYSYTPGSIGYATTTVDNLPGRFSTDPATGLSVRLPGNTTLNYTLKGRETEWTEGEAFRSVIQAGGNISARFTRDISNTLTTANTAGFSNTVVAPALTPLSKTSVGSAEKAQSLTRADTTTLSGPAWRDAISDALQELSGGELDNASGKGAYTSAWPLPSGKNGYFVPASDPNSPYLITVNPKLDGLGQLDSTLYRDLHALLGMKPGDAPRETNSAFTDTKQFLGSAYFLGKLGLNPERDYRFLGDAAFDTRYVSNAVLNLTGSRYINGVGSDMEQMRYLMDSAAAQQQKLGLKFGVSLTAEQVAALNGSLLWWESATVNGQTVMIPKVYLSPKDVTVQRGSVITANNVQLAGGNVSNSGSTISATSQLNVDSSNSLDNLNAGLVSAGGNLNLSALGDINNIGSTISGKRVSLESVGGSINNQTRVQQWSVGKGTTRFSGTDVGNTASISATDALTMRAGQDINVTGANVSAGGSLGMAAGQDITIAANDIAESQTRKSGKKTIASASVAVQNSTLTAGDNLVLVAGNDVTARAAGIAAQGDVGIQAGRDVNLLAEATSEFTSSKSKKKTSIDESVRQQGTAIASGGNTAIIAGRDITAQAADVTAQGDIRAAAGRDVTLTTATESDYRFREKTKTSSGFLSKKTTHTITEDSNTREKGALLSGDNVSVSAGNNLLVKGSAVAGDGDVQLRAGNDVDIVAATNSDTSWRFKETKKSGLMGTGGIGFTIGSSKTTHDMREKGTTQSDSFSTVGSTGGNVSIAAGKQAHIGGADLIAKQDLAITGDSVVIDPGHDKRTRDEKYEQKSSGLTVALSGVVGSALNTAVQAAQEAKEESDGRLAALQATKAVLSGVQASKGADVAQANGDPNNGIGVSISLNSQKSKSENHLRSDAVAGSTLNAGSNLAITATGQGKGANSGDILISGSQLKAGGDTSLSAVNDIVLGGAASTQQSTGKNSSSGGGVGVSIGGGTNGYGISVFANVNASRGSEKGNGTAWNETTLDSGGTVSMTSGRDAILDGAQVSGDNIIADIGRDLRMRSQQDSNDFKSKQTSVAAGGSFTFGSMTGSGYISASQDRMKSTYDSVQEQTGLFAGQGGFDVTVGRHTQLDGAAIASAATAEKNSLDTGTLGFSDIGNAADYKVSHTGISLSGGSSFGSTSGGSMAGGAPAMAASSGHAEGITRAAIGAGTITVRDQDKQQQNIAGLSRDTDNANGSIGPIFDREKEQKRLAAVGLVIEIGSQVSDIAKKQGELNGLKKAREAHPEMTAEQLKNTPEYRKVMAEYGTGSNLQRGIQAATAALQGLAGGNIAGGLAAAAAPQLAHMLKSTEDKPEVNILAHAILGGAVAAMQGNSVAAGAAGAGVGELAAHGIMATLYPGKEASDLGEDDRQLISTLATISAGMAGGLAGNGTSSAATGALAGRNAAENNALSKDKPGIFDINPMLKTGVVDESGDPLKGGGGIAKGGKSKDTQIWTETKKAEPVGNAYGHWTKHGKEFPEYQNAKQYVDAAHNFMTTPPSGTLTKTRPNGDTLYYNPATNIFASKDINGVPRTMFKPEKGLEYWNKQ